MPTVQTGPARLYTIRHPSTPFCVVHRDPTRREKSGRAKRIPKWFAKQGDAETYRDQLNERLLAEGAAGVTFDAHLRGDAIAARRWLDTNGHMQVSLLQLAQGHTKGAPHGGVPKLIGPLVKRFLEDKEAAEGCTSATIVNLKNRIWAWLNREGITTTAEIRRDRMDGMRRRTGISAHGRKNDMAAVSSFCTWLLDQTPPLIDHHPLKGLKRPKIENKAKAVYLPDECERLLKAAQAYLNGKWLGTIAALLFVGPRPSELAQTLLTYGRQPLARIEGGKLRGRANRLVKLLPAATAWLRSAGSPSRVVPINQTARNKILKMAKLEYTPDVLRHTFISCRLAMLKDTAAVAIEAGTSEDVIFRNYHRPMLASHARIWAGLRPDKN